MSDEDEEQVNELLANTLENEESIEDLFEQRAQQQKHSHKSEQNKRNNVRT